MNTIGLVSTLILLGAGNGAQAPAEQPLLQKTEYHGIRPTDPGGRCGLRNPERGLRTETLIAELPGAGVWGPSYHLRGKVPNGYTDDWWLLDARRYEPYGLTLVQTYCYLDHFVDCPISDQKLRWLQRSLNRLREAGLKALLRFAYEKDMKKKAGPTVETILAHLDQLRPIIRKNADVIDVLQAGFVGAWGEWHNSTQAIEKDHAKLATIVARILEVLPNNRMTQVRVPKYKRWVLSQPVLEPFQVLEAATAFSTTPAARIGFHDDGFLAEETDGGTWPESPHYANPGNPEFDYMTKESAYLPVDGELFWADQGGAVDGLRAAIRMRLHHYNSFSLAHSYSEREGKPFSIDTWMKTPLTADQVLKAKLPLSNGYFKDNKGRPVSRTEFEYIRDHLGYRIELQRTQFPKWVKPGDAFSIEVELINRGFSVMHNPRPAQLVLIDTEGNIAATGKADVDPRTWQPAQPGDPNFKPLTHRFATTIHLADKLKPGVYMVGFWMPDASERLKMDPRYAVRVANRDAPWWINASGGYGINLLGTIEVRYEQK